MRLEIKHLAPYFSHGLRFTDGKSMWELVGMNSDGEMRLLEAQYRGEINHRDGWNGIKPILLPLSSLTKPITHKGETFVPMDYFLGEDPDILLNAIQIKDLSWIPYNIIQKLHEWHIDTENLIGGNLAIDANTLPENPYAK